jgi:5-methylcytosine-specific restriction endonuclease McrA
VNGRSKPLRRRTALRPGGPLKRTELKRKTRLRSVRPAMSPAERHGKDVVRARSGGLCEACGMRRAAEVHHRKNRSQGGTWDPANLLDVCRTCHRWVGAERPSARARGWAVWRDDDPAALPVLRRDTWVLLAADGQLTPVIRYTGAPWAQCESTNGPLRCALGVLHDPDHECGLVTWPVLSEERASV